MTCSDCAKPISKLSRSGLCRPCAIRRLNADPEFQAKRLKALRESPALQKGSETRLRVGRAANATRMKNPFYVAALRKRMRDKIQPLAMLPENMAKRDEAARGRAVSETKMKWCPPEYRALYRGLIRNNFKMAEAKEMVFAQAAADRKRKAAEARARKDSLKTLEGQMRALERGARLAANDTGPSFGEPADYGEAKWERLHG
jgi:hypothetical protein